MRRLFCENLAIGPAELPAEEAHHAVGVLRLGQGAEVELFDGAGGVGAGRIVQAARGKVVVEVESLTPATLREKPELHLAFAVPKGKRLDWLLEKATELGAASLRAVIFRRSIAGGAELSESKRRRWRLHCISAAKQCGLNRLPEIHPPEPLERFLAGAVGMFALLGGVGEGAARLHDALADRRGEDAICILVGPEGGLTDEEQALALSGGFRLVRLGAATLRVETAAVALLAATTALCR